MAIKNKDIDAKYKGKAFYTTIIKKIAESRNIWGDVTSKIITTADMIYDPSITVSAAKNFEGNCILPEGTWEMTDGNFQLKRWVGNSISDCKVDLETVEYNVEDYQREALLSGIVLKLNTNTTADIVAGATPEAAVIDLSTTEKITDFVMGVQSNHTNVVSAKSTLDNGVYKRAPLQGKPYIAASSPIINRISAVLGYENIKSGATSDIGRIRTTIGGVILIDLRDAADQADRIVYGTGGAANAVYRKDEGFGVTLKSGSLTTREEATAVDLDIAIGDKVFKTLDYFGGAIKTEAHVFDSNKTLIYAGTANIVPA